MTIGGEEELRAKFGEVHPLASAKSRPALDTYSRQFIGLSPFLVISTADANGRADLSPRGDPPGFVHILDDTTILVPDRPGNNRLDTMANITANPNVGLLFFVPGFEDTLRLNGKARITDDAALLSACTVNGRQPVVGILITVEEVFLHCAKALMRSQLWDASRHSDRTALPTMGEMLRDQIRAFKGEEIEAETQAQMMERYRQSL